MKTTDIKNTFDQVLEEIVKICICCGVKEVYLYGSRAKGTALDRSDIDIAAKGADCFEALEEQIEEIPTLYKIDLLNLDRCCNQNLLEDIRNYGRKIYPSVSQFL